MEGFDHFDPVSFIGTRAFSILVRPCPINSSFPGYSSAFTSSADIRIGTDGVVLRKDGKSAVFLPQVAPEQGWDLETTLKHLSMKAGLPTDARKEGATFLTFQADVFGENEK